MTRTPDELATAITDHAAQHGVDLPLADDAVRAQAYPVDLSRWAARWPRGLDLPARLVGADEQPVAVTRGEVLERGRELATEQDAVDLYVLLGGWATGYQELSATRTMRPLQDDGTGAALLRSARLVRKGRAVHAYESLWRGDNRIKRVGPSLFTAWLYAAAHDTWDAANGPVPLALDHRAARVVGWTGARVSAAAYGRYLELADATAALLTKRLGRPVTPHAVEHALMTMGR